MTVTVRSTSDLVAVVPSLLGCTPTDSIVAIGVTNNRLCVTARIDIPTAPDRMRLACQITQAMTKAGASKAWILTYQSEPTPAAPAAVDVLTEVLEACGITTAPAIDIMGDPLHDATITDAPAPTLRPCQSRSFTRCDPAPPPAPAMTSRPASKPDRAPPKSAQPSRP